MLCASETKRPTEGGEFDPYQGDEIIWPTSSSMKRACIANVTTNTNAVRLGVWDRLGGGDRKNNQSVLTRALKFLKEKN